MSGNRVHRNAIYNIFGSIIPIIIAFITVPMYIKLVGEVRYGLIALIWLAFGYFGVFDLGLSRATAYKLSSLNAQVLSARANVFYTACIVNLALGVASAICFYLLTPTLARYFTDNIQLQEEITRSLPWVALFFPIGLLGGIFSGCLQSQELFLQLNVQQSVGSVVLQILPLLCFYYGNQSLDSAVIGAVIARTFNVAWLGFVCIKWMYPAWPPSFQRNQIKDLFSYGGWITISDMIAPILNGLDQIIIGATLGARATAHYSVPFSMSLKILIIPASLNRALFPKLTAVDEVHAHILGIKSMRIIAGAMAIVCSPSIILSKPVLELWIDKEFASFSYLTASILLVGMWFNSIGYVPWTLLQARGRPDIVAKIHAIELAPFIGLLAGMIYLFGLPGAAVAWCIRIIIDLFLQTFYSKMNVDCLASTVFPGLLVVLSLMIVFFGFNLAGSLTAALLMTIVATAWLLIRTDILSYLKLVLFYPRWVRKNEVA